MKICKIPRISDDNSDENLHKDRQVRKGETSIKIFDYSTKTTDADDDATDQEERIVRFFPVLSVFDITQTDPIPGACVTENPLQRLTGENDHGIVGRLTAHLEGKGWAVSRQLLAWANGYTDPTRRTVIIARDLAPEQAAKTLIHEAAHIQLGHIDNLAEYRQHRGRMEVEAESVAYIVAALAGFDTSAYSIGYIAGWTTGDTEVIKATAARVLHTAHQIADLVQPAADAGAGA
ncbi:MAG TPA: hypothetical protein VIJ18_04650 [Microbacteriaceae bacterium]